MAFRASQKSLNFFLRTGESRRGKGECAEAVVMMVNPLGFSIITIAGARGERGR